MSRQFACGAATLLLLAAMPAAAERPDDKYWLSGQAFFSSANSSIRLDQKVTSTPGTIVDFENDLGFSPNSTGPTVLIGGRLSDSWRLEGEFLSIKRSGSSTLARSITIQDVVYNLGASLSSKFDTNIFRVSVGWSPVKTETAEFGVSLGAHLTNFKVEFTGVGSVNGNAGSVVTKAAKQLAPLPTIGLYGSYILSPMFSLYGRGDVFALKIGDYSGHLIDAQGGVQARIIRNLGIGAGWRYTDYGLGISKDKFDGRVVYKFNGPVVFAELAF